MVPTKYYHSIMYNAVHVLRIYRVNKDGFMYHHASIWVYFLLYVVS